MEGFQSSWQELKQFEKLNLSRNRLVGPIPLGPKFNTFSNDSYSGNFGLSGFPLSKSFCKEDEAEEESDEQDNTIELDWKIVMMGYAYIVLSEGKCEYWIGKRFEGLQQRKRTRRLMENARLSGGRRNKQDGGKL